MPRTIDETIVCDLEGCSKQPNKANNRHVTVGVSLLNMDPPSTALPAGMLDFCSFDHAAKFIRDQEKLVAAEEKERAEQDVPADTDG